MSAEFLAFSVQRGNDLVTPNPLYDFPGLKAGDRWCLCAARWLEAEKAGVAPKVLLAAVNHAALDIIPMETLSRYAV
jgi:hypothetical protein